MIAAATWLETFEAEIGPAFLRCTQQCEKYVRNDTLPTDFKHLAGAVLNFFHDLLRVEGPNEQSHLEEEQFALPSPPPNN